MEITIIFFVMIFVVFPLAALITDFSWLTLGIILLSYGCLVTSVILIHKQAGKGHGGGAL